CDHAVPFHTHVSPQYFTMRSPSSCSPPNSTTCPRAASHATPDPKRRGGPGAPSSIQAAPSNLYVTTVGVVTGLSSRSSISPSVPVPIVVVGGRTCTRPPVTTDHALPFHSQVS